MEAKTALAGAVVIATVAHSMTGRMTSNRGAIMVSRLLAMAIFAGSLGIFVLAARLTEGA